VSSVTEEWLDYAWDVVSEDGSVSGHRTECERLGGAFCGERCEPRDATLRYPDYLGSNYESGPIMLVGAVHSGNALFTEPFRHVEAATKNWRVAGRSASSDEAYLGEMRAGYGAAMPGWGPWRNGFGSILEALEVSIDGTAYTNVAKCWSKPREPSPISGNQDDLLMEFCLMESEYGIASLIAMLQPRQIYVSARNVFRAVEQWSSWVVPPERVWVFNANTGVLLRGNGELSTLADAKAQYDAIAVSP
jgi:hypothetical protein